MRKLLIFVILATMLISVFALSGCSGGSRYGNQILEGGEKGPFDFANLAELREVWTLDGGNGGSGIFGVISNGDGANFVTIDTAGAGWAQMSQKVRLRTYSYYKVTYSYTTPYMQTHHNAPTGSTFDGLFVGFKENPDFNIRNENPTEETFQVSNPKTATYYFKTTSMREVSLAINVGTELNQVSATNVIIRNIELTRVTRKEANGRADGIRFYTLEASVFGAPTQLNTVFVVLGAIGTIIIAYAFYMFRARSKALDIMQIAVKPKWYTFLKENKWGGALIVIGVTLLVRLLITLIEAMIAGGKSIQTAHFGYDLEGLAGNGLYSAMYGITKTYEANSVQHLMPFATYLITIAGLFGRLIGLAGGATVATEVLTTVTVIKLFAIMADVGTVLIIYKLVNATKQGKISAIASALLYSLLPVVFITSSAFGAIESISAFFVVLAFYFILNKNYIGMAISYFSAVMVSTNALLVVPFMLAYTAMIIIRSIKAKDYKWIMPIVAIGAGLLFYWMISVPMFINAGLGGAPYSYFVNAVRMPDLYSMNAFNFQAMIGNNFQPVTTESFVVTILFIIFVVGVLAYAYFKSNNRLSLLGLSCAFILVYWYFCNNMTPMSLFIVLPLLYIYTVLVQDKRLYALFAVLATSMFINFAYLYMITGYTSNGYEQIGSAYTITFGIINLIILIAYVMVGYDTVIAKKNKAYLVLNVPFHEYAISVGKNVVIGFRNFGYRVKGIVNSFRADIKEKKASKKNKENDKTE
ncbi:MAG: hypothetical protein FWD49_02425 [Firmicutes bacterium]|nr:hypothetical protein [Bacillota bacterium]